MKPELKKSLMHGLELLGVLVASFILEFLLGEVIPNLPKTEVVTFLTLILGALAKYLRANPNFPKIPDYVNRES